MSYADDYDPAEPMIIDGIEISAEIVEFVREIDRKRCTLAGEDNRYRWYAEASVPSLEEIIRNRDRIANTPALKRKT